jgi:AraC-like DNA-binding protein
MTCDALGASIAGPARKALVGEPVMANLTRRRMQVAAAAIADGQTTIGELANRLGYRSEAAVARAFKCVMGAPPGAVTGDAGISALAGPFASSA